MKIAVVGPAHPYRGGIAHFAVRLAQELQKKHKILFINFTRLYPEFLFPGKTQIDESGSPIEFCNERIIDSLSPNSWTAAGKLVRDNECDALLFHWWHPFFGPAYSAIVGRVSDKTKSVSICHNVLPHEHNVLNRLAVKFGLRKMSGFVLHSEDDRESLLELMPARPTVKLYHPLYDIFPNQDITKLEARDRIGLAEHDRVVLYFGLIRPYKGVDVLLNAVKHLKDIQNLKILIVGEIYSGSTSIREQISRLPSGIVRLVDQYISNDEVSTWFRAADIVALPYLSATQSGVVPIAYSCDRPVIVTKVGGLPEVVMDKESGYIVEPRDSLGLAHCIRKHFIDNGNPSLKNGIATMKMKLGWDKYAAELTKFIGSLSQ